MPRPRKSRRVCSLPKRDRFGPLNCHKSSHPIVMTVDEYETIRLIDLYGYTQENCATQMNVARTTIQAIYNIARHKLAEALVNGSVLRIEGGEIQVCNGQDQSCGGKNCRIMEQHRKQKEIIT